MKTMMLAAAAATLAACATVGGSAAAPGAITGATTCSPPPRIDCPEANCQPALTGAAGNATEPKTKRKFFLDYPCDLKSGEDVIFVLNLHGMGSIGNWQRHYFPIVDYKEKYRIVVATPTAATSEPSRRWVAEADDAYLANLVDAVVEEFGKENIKSFWLAGHSQGGLTSRRIVCSDYFKDKVDGWVSLSGGRLGQTQFTFARSGSSGAAAAQVGSAGATEAATGAQGGGGAPAQPQAEQLPTCDLHHIFVAGQLEIAGLPETSPWAAKYGCKARVRRPDLIDTRPGYVTATDQSRGPSWGRFARPGRAEEWIYPDCRDGKVVADIVRLDKGHTEGLEPVVTEEIARLIASAPGGKLRGR